jgi:hypothetical protein
MLDYEKFLKYKYYHKVAKKVKTISPYEVASSSVEFDDGIFDTLRIVYPQIIFGGVLAPMALDHSKSVHLIKLLENKLKFVRRLEIVECFVGPGSENFLKNLLNNYIVKNLIFTSCQLYMKSMYGLNIDYSDSKNIAMNEYITYELTTYQTNIRKNNININGLEVLYRYDFYNSEILRKVIDNILVKTTENRERYNMHMKKILWIYTRPGLFSLLPVDLIDIIISNIYMNFFIIKLNLFV